MHTIEKRNRRFLHAGFAALFIVACFGLFPSRLLANAVPGGKPGVGDPAPSFTSVDLDGGKVSLEEILRGGKVILLNFWGLRCSACIEEIGYLNPIYGVYKEKGVVFLGVNVDGVKADIIRQMMPKMPAAPQFPVIPDPEFKIPDQYNLAGAPLSIVIGRDGKVLYRHEDFKPGDEKGIEDALLKAVSSEIQGLAR